MAKVFLGELQRGGGAGFPHAGRAVGGQRMRMLDGKQSPRQPHRERHQDHLVDPLQCAAIAPADQLRELHQPTWLARDERMEGGGGDHQQLAGLGGTRVVHAMRVDEERDLAEPLPGFQQADHCLAPVLRRAADLDGTALDAEERVRVGAVGKQHLALDQLPAHGMRPEQCFELGRKLSSGGGVIFVRLRSCAHAFAPVVLLMLLMPLRPDRCGTSR